MLFLTSEMTASTTRCIRAAIVCIAAASTTVAAAQDRHETAIQSRIANFRELGTAFKYITDELKSKQPNRASLQESAELIKSRGADMPHWFPPGSEPPPEAPSSWLDTILGWFSTDGSAEVATEAKSHAKPAIWTEQAQFEKAFRTFDTEADRMRKIAANGDIAAISVQFSRLGNTCKGCHDLYREELD